MSSLSDSEPETTSESEYVSESKDIFDNEDVPESEVIFSLEDSGKSIAENLTSWGSKLDQYFGEFQELQAASDQAVHDESRRSDEDRSKLENTHQKLERLQLKFDVNRAKFLNQIKTARELMDRAVSVTDKLNEYVGAEIGYLVPIQVRSWIESVKYVEKFNERMNDEIYWFRNKLKNAIKNKRHADGFKIYKAKIYEVYCEDCRDRLKKADKYYEEECKHKLKALTKEMNGLEGEHSDMQNNDERAWVIRATRASCSLFRKCTWSEKEHAPLLKRFRYNWATVRSFQREVPKVLQMVDD